MEIATSRYWNRRAIEESGLAPIATSVGLPKFSVGYELAGTVGMLAPYGLRQIEDDEEFERRYCERLDSFGVDKIRRVLEAFAYGADAKGVVLLSRPNSPGCAIERSRRETAAAGPCLLRS